MMRPYFIGSRPLWAALLMAGLLEPSAGFSSPAEAPAVEDDAADKLYDPSLYQALEYRGIGPYRGGRSSAVTGFPGEPHVFLMGTAGGVWRTTNAGETWENVTDRDFETGSIGAIAVAESDPNVIYVGTGQSTIRGNVSTGVGVYKSTDRGRSWKHVGLREVGQIARIRIHPRDPDLVYVAAVGHAFGPNDERGLFRSNDGGDTWEKIFYVSPRTGLADLAMDANNPRVLYAAAWTVERKPWTIISGSEESGLFKTTDGGDNWEQLSGGLPTGLVGKIGVAVSPANSNRIWALVEAEEGGLFRSDDAGKTWRRMETNQRRRLYQRSWYYMHVFADPRDENTVYVLNVDSFKSIDGGQTFEEIDTLAHGDGHDLWIHPDDTDTMILAFDGGATITLDGGKTWSSLNNQPTAEIYFVTADNQFPYHVYGPQQDNSTMRLPSRFSSSLTPYEHWKDVGGCEDGHIAVDPRDPNIVYAGCYGGEITRVNLATDEYRQILAYMQMEVGLAPKDLRYRFNWNAPIRISPHDPGVLYHASQFVHRSTDEGHSWTVISPDLSRNDKSKQDYAGEPITKENTGIEVYSNILSFEESPHTPGLLWAGSSDGLVHVSRNGGETWDDITPREMPEWGAVNAIELSPHDPGRAFIAVLKHMFEDYRPYIFRTNDYGKSWKLLTNGENGIPGDHPTRAVREDPDRKGLLYAGTEFGVFVSFDDGAHWQSLQLNLPIVPVTDVRVHEKDLVLSTQGRGFWILDDVTPLHQIDETVAGVEAHLFKPRDMYRMRLARTGVSDVGAGANPPNGAMIFYTFAKAPQDEVILEILAPDGELIQTYSSDHDPHPNPPEIFMGRAGEKRVSKKAGMNRFVWDLRYPVVDIVPDAIVWGFTGGPRAKPGTYQARLKVGDWSQTQSFQVLKDPRIGTTGEEFDEQLDLLLQMRDSLNQTYDGVRTVRSARQQVEELVKRLAEAGHDVDELESAAKSLSRKLTGIEEELMQPKNQADQDVENFPTKLDNQLAYVYWYGDMADARPTEGQKERYADLKVELDDVLARLQDLIATDLAAFNGRVQGMGVEPVILPTGRRR